MNLVDRNPQGVWRPGRAFALSALLSVSLAGVFWLGSLLAPGGLVPVLALAGAAVGATLGLSAMHGRGPRRAGVETFSESFRSEQIVRDAAEAVLAINQRGRVLALNPAAERLFGYRSAEAVNQPITQLLVEPPPHERQKLFHDTLPVGSILGLAAGAREMIGKRKNGDTFPLELAGSSMTVGDESVSVAFVRDVSNRKQAQRYLIAHYAATCILAEANTLAEALPRVLQTICEALRWEAGGYWQFDPGAGVACCAEVYTASFAGLPPRPGAEPLTCRPGEGLPGRALSTGKASWVEDLLNTQDCLGGVVARLHLHGAFAIPILLGEEVCGVMTFFSCRKQKRDGQLLDIMVELGKQLGHFIARKRDEERLRETTQTLEALVHAAPVAIHIIDLEGKVRLWNPAAERIFGWAAAEVLGQPLPLLQEGGREAGGMPAPVATGRSHHGLPTRSQRKDGAVIEGSLSTAPLRDTAGNVFGVMGIQIDLTEQKQLEDQLRQAQKMEAVGQLAGGVAHDFNNLLTIITGYSEILLANLKPGEPARDFLEQIEKAGNRAAGLTRQLLAFSRRQILRPRVLDLNDLVAEVQRMLGRLIGEDVQLFTRLAPALGRVKADPGQIEQILVNLAVNARDAMPHGGKLIVETQDVKMDEAGARLCPGLRPGRYALLAVSDTGCGMDKQTLGRIFEPFFTTKEQGKGTGLGLATVYGIVKQSGGCVFASSEVGKGATFKVYFPIVEEGPATQGELHRRAPAPGGKETVLLVEDEEGVRALAQEVLRSNGYTVLVAEDGEEALRVMGRNEGKVDLVLTDVVMPHLGGRELAEVVAARYPGVQVVYISGYTDDTVIRHGVLECETEFLQKPFTMDALLHKVREALDKNRCPCLTPC